MAIRVPTEPVLLPAGLRRLLVSAALGAGIAVGGCAGGPDAAGDASSSSSSSSSATGAGADATDASSEALDEDAAVVPRRLVGTWRLESLQGEVVDPPAAMDAETPSIALAADGSVTGTTGVNRLTGRVEAEGLGSDALGFAPLATTRRAGPPAAMELERRFLQVLEMTDRMRREGAALVLARGDRELARLLPGG